MKATTRNSRIANFENAGRCFHAGKDNSFNSIDYFAAVALSSNDCIPIGNFFMMLLFFAKLHFF
jgi:hypothetical protein